MFKNNLFLVIMLTLAFILSCDNNDDKKSDDKIKSIEEQINSARPISQIILRYRLNVSSYESFSINSDYSDAYAEDGILIMVRSSTNYYAININNADDILIEGHVVQIIYYRP